MKRDFEFDGSGFGYLWLCIWTTVLTVITCGLFFPWAYSAQQRWITCGLFFPWAYSAQQRWICSNTYVNGRQLRFEGTGFGFFFQWLLIMMLTTITFGIYIPWGYCQFKRWETRNTVFAD